MALLSELRDLFKFRANNFVYTPNQTFQITVGVNLLSQTVADTVALDLHAVPGANGQHFTNFAMVVQGNTAITTGSFLIEGSNDPTFPASTTVSMDYTNSIAPSAIGVGAISPTSGAITQYYVMNPLSLRYVRARISVVFAGATTGARINTVVFQSNDRVPGFLRSFIINAPNVGTVSTVTGVTTVSTVTAVTTVSANQLAPQSTAIVDVASAAITTVGLTNSAAITPTWGVSQIFSIVVTAVSGTSPTMDVVVQESPDSGTTWNNIYTFPTITANGTYTSPLIAQSGKQYRYAQTLAGTSPSFTRVINRYQSNVFVPPYAGVTRLGGITSPADIFIGARFVRRIQIYNTTATFLYVQYFNKAAALTTGDIPVSAEIYPLPTTTAPDVGACIIYPSDLPANGLNYGANTRIGISSTRSTYTAAAMTGVNVLIEVTA